MLQYWVGTQLKAALHSLSLASSVKAFSYSLCKYSKRSCAILLSIKRLMQLLMELKGHLLWMTCPPPIGKLPYVCITGIPSKQITELTEDTDFLLQLPVFTFYRGAKNCNTSALRSPNFRKHGKIKCIPLTKIPIWFYMKWIMDELHDKTCHLDQIGCLYMSNQ